MAEKEVVLMKGNEAIAHAAIRCGCDGYFGYPITPQSEVLETLALEKPWETTGMVVLQAESEVASINMVYGGGASAIAALLGGHIDVTVQSPADGKEYVRSGDLRAIAVLNTERLTDSVYADVPTSVEQGYPWLINVGFQGFSLPKGTPQNIVDFYRECFRNALADPVIMEETEKLGMIPAYLDADEFSAFIDESVANYKEIFSALEGRLD